MALRFIALFLGCLLASAEEIRVIDSEEDIVILRGNAEILTYHKTEVLPPKGAKKAYRRSGFIHPLKSPKGGVVTGIHPSDHLHHLGLWHAWVKSKHGKDQPDFWNLGKESGRVRFLKLLKRNATGFTVEQEQVAFKGGERAETIILKEALSISVKATKEGNFIDYHLTQKNVSNERLDLPVYRYGGPLAYRGPHSWNSKNSNYLTSAGKKREDSHATRADWCAIFGPT
ncbi:MAG: PmoA family protein, partial [Akkermansiaceae bacterium]|nr:PmoA family protein [Akkermansiaceae bacterium]